MKIVLYNRDLTTRWRREVIDTTAGGILQVIYEHYKAYEDDEEEEEDMGEGILFQGLTQFGNVWIVSLGS